MKFGRFDEVRSTSSWFFELGDGSYYPFFLGRFVESLGLFGPQPSRFPPGKVVYLPALKLTASENT